jgi:hypothetical protein
VYEIGKEGGLDGLYRMVGLVSDGDVIVDAHQTDIPNSARDTTRDRRDGQENHAYRQHQERRRMDRKVFEDGIRAMFQ